MILQSNDKLTLLQENYYVPTQITSKGKAFLGTKVTKLRVQLLAAWLNFKLQNCRTSPKNKKMRHHVLTSSPFSLPFTSHKLQPDLSFSTWPLARCQNFHYSYIYKEKVSNLWLEQMFVVIVHSLLLLPVKLKVKLSFPHKTNETSTLQKVRAPNVFRSKLF